jgi:hypothetical protein
MEIEIWKDIPEYEGLYQVSNFGNVKSLNYKRSGKEKILKPQPNNKGYLRIGLSKNGNSTLFFVHRLVASVFLKNDNNLPIINHKDENPLNNHVDNLEWCTHEYNMNYGTCKERMSINVSKALKGKYKGENHWSYGKSMSEEMKNILYNTNRKTVLLYNVYGVLLDEFESVKQASIETNINYRSIALCASGKRKTAGGFLWKYKE